ncbi:DUF3467 domain-containing protein [Candidatus Nitrospira bockiana]
MSDTVQPLGQQQPAKVSWTEAGPKGHYANSCTVSSTREEVVLNFGQNQMVDPIHNEIQIQLTDRIIVSPYTAKRLAYLLTAVVQQYEAKFGALDLGAAQAAPESVASSVKPSAPAGR